MKNYICFGGRRKIGYAYVDTDDYLADGLFNKYNVYVKFGDEYVRENEEFRIIFCKVKKKHIEGFEKAMEELKKKMLICGHTRYDEFCDDIISAMEEA